MVNNKYVSLSKLQTFLEKLNDKFSQISHKHTIADITDYVVDTELSSDSNNPVANSVLEAEFNAVATALNALDMAIDNHNHDDRYYAKTEIDGMEFIFVEDIDEICGQTLS